VPRSPAPQSRRRKLLKLPLLRRLPRQPRQGCAAAAAAPAPQAAAPAAQSNGHGGRVFSSPLARRLAKDAGIDVAMVTGTGPHGRVVARDVEQAKSGKGLKAPAASPSAAPSVAPTMSDKQILSLFEPGSYEVVPHDGMRRTIAQRLTASIQNVPHFYLTIDCDIGKLLAAARRSNAAAPKDKEKSRSTRSRSTTSSSSDGGRASEDPELQCELDRSGMVKHHHPTSASPWRCPAA